MSAFGAAVIAAFAVAYGIGAAVPPIAAEASGHERGTSSSSRSGHSSSPQPSQATTASAMLPGLASTESGYTFVPRGTTWPRGEEVQFEFTIIDARGTPVAAYTRKHETELHLIVVRRDLSHFQHVHPTRTPDGTWRVSLRLPVAGAYRAFADFQPAALGRGLTLGTDLAVAGEFTPASLPEPASSTRVDGYEVTLDGDPVPGRESELTFTITRNGRKVTDLQPYLGAFGHLVSLRAGDLAYLHTHPAEKAHDGQRGGPDVRFATEFPTVGTYRLFLDFKVGGVVRTAAFTVFAPRTSDGDVSLAPTQDETTDAHKH
jgi:hypothetical protein